MTIFKSSTKGELQAKKVSEQARTSTMPKGAKPNVPYGCGGNVKAGPHHK